MTDTLSKIQRSKLMSRVRSKNTSPEMIIRRLVFSLKYRYRLHDKHLPGSPDLVFKSKRKVIFVNGCFWHRHEKCKFAKLPKTNLKFWRQKLEGNKNRDILNQIKLKKMGWDYIVIWECEKDNIDKLSHEIKAFLSK